MISPCGMNCAICMAYLREKNHCNGCRSTSGYKSTSCFNCLIRNCGLLEKTNSKFCFDCAAFPCSRLKHLDKRYRLRYRMSMLENLEFIKKSGVENFAEKEFTRWRCLTCGGTICVHKGYCLSCSTAKPA
jgi:hypothetical protein